MAVERLGRLLPASAWRGQASIARGLSRHAKAAYPIHEPVITILALAFVPITSALRC